MGKSFLALSLTLLLTIANGIDFQEKDLASEESLRDLYERWRGHHSVSRDLDEKQRRFNAFKENVKFIHAFNKKDAPYKLKLNKFGDMTNQEFRSTYAGSRVQHHRIRRGSPRGSGSFMYEEVTQLPSSIDWRTKGAVTEVKDQGQCGKIISSYCQ